MAGWLKLHRCFLGWEWYRDTNTKVIFLHLLLLANHGESRYKGFTLHSGQLITSFAEISEATGLTVRQVRTAINHLKTTREVTIKTTNKFSVITLENWAFYQNEIDEATSKTTRNGSVKRQASDTQPTRLIEECKEFNNDKKERNISVPAKPAVTNKFILPSVEDVTDYCRERGNSVDPSRFIDFYTSKGWLVGKNKMKCWKAAVRTWEKNQSGGVANDASGNSGGYYKIGGADDPYKEIMQQ